MSKLRVLLYKEWRDQRALCLGALVLCLLLIAIAKTLMGSHFDSQLRMKYVLPVCLGVFAIVLATEGIARDAHDGVEGTLLRLPVPRTLIWLAKCCFVALASLGCLVVLTLVEITLRLLEHPLASDPRSFVIAPTLLLAVAALAAACLACACALKRSLPAALAGIALVLAVPVLAPALPAGRTSERMDLVLGSWSPAALATLACGAFLLGSLLAFRVRRPDRLGLRRAAGLASGTVLVLAPLIAVTAQQSAWALDIEPFSQSAEITNVYPSPDGRFLAVEAEQMWTPRSNWLPLTGSGTGTGCRVRREVWILDRSTRALHGIDDRFRVIAGDVAWETDGRLVTLSAPGAFGDGEFAIDRIDPVSGSVVSSHLETSADALGSWYSKVEYSDELVVRWKARRIDLRLPKDAWVVPAPQPGVVFHEQDGFLVRHELAPDCTSRLVALQLGKEHPLLSCSPDGRFLFLSEGKDHKLLLDACNGSIVHRFDARSSWAGWSQCSGRICFVWHAGEAWSVLDENGSLTPLSAFSGEWHELGVDELFTCDRRRIECMKLDGSARQVLYEARP